jgi:hypothetical protein
MNLAGKNPSYLHTSYIKEKDSVILPRFTWRLPLAMPGFNQEGPHNKHNYRSHSQSDEIPLGKN